MLTPLQATMRRYHEYKESQMMFVYFEGDGDTLISGNAIREHFSKPQRFRAFGAQDAVRLTGWSWPGEHSYVECDTEDEGEQFRRALDAKVFLNLYQGNSRPLA